LITVSPVSAHFLFLLPGANRQPAQVILSNAPQPDPTADLRNLGTSEVIAWTAPGVRSETTLTPKYDEKSQTLAFPAQLRGLDALSMSLTRGVANRGEGHRWLIRHHAFWQQSAGSATRETGLPLAVQALKSGDGIVFRADFGGKTLTNHDLLVYEPGETRPKVMKTDLKGDSAQFSKPGIYAVRVALTDPTPGEHEGLRYQVVKHYSTLVVELAPKP
jgi:hypothetical protein